MVKLIIHNPQQLQINLYVDGKKIKLVNNKKNTIELTAEKHTIQLRQNMYFKSNTIEIDYAEKQEFEITITSPHLEIVQYYRLGKTGLIFPLTLLLAFKMDNFYYLLIAPLDILVSLVIDFYRFKKKTFLKLEVIN